MRTSTTMFANNVLRCTSCTVRCADGSDEDTGDFAASPPHARHGRPPARALLIEFTDVTNVRCVDDLAVMSASVKSRSESIYFDEDPDLHSNSHFPCRNDTRFAILFFSGSATDGQEMRTYFIARTMCR